MEEALREDIRDGFCTPLALVVPNLRPELADAIDRILRNRGTAGEAVPGEVAASQMLEFLQYLGPPGSSLQQTLPNDGIERSKEVLQQLQKRADRERRDILRKRFLKKYRAFIMLAVGGLAAMGLIIYTVISDQQQKPTTRGLEPEAVVELYYRSFNTLDHQTMEACVQKGIGKQDIEGVINFFVISRVREAYERKTSIIDPETYRREYERLEKLPPGLTVFGIADMQIEPTETVGTSRAIHRHLRVILPCTTDCRAR
ncbi:MAG: hypothetical protein SNJ56_05160 [Termitinemataceae bacterium]